jgi:hypothetical protein
MFREGGREGPIAINVLVFFVEMSMSWWRTNASLKRRALWQCAS